MKKINKKFMAIALVGTFTFGGVGASATFANTEDLNPEVVEENNAQHADNMQPEAVPAVVATAFAVPAAAAVGDKVGGWVADKIIGIWSVEEQVSEEVNLEVLFD